MSSNPCDFGRCDPSRCNDADCIGEVENNKNTIKEEEEVNDVQQEDNMY